MRILRMLWGAWFLITWNSCLFQCIILEICLFIPLLIAFLKLLLIFILLYMYIVLAPALILKLRVTPLLKWMVPFWYRWNLAFFLLSQVRLHLPRFFLFLFVIVPFWNSFLDYFVFGGCLVCTLCWLHRSRVKHLVEFIFASHLFFNLHLAQCCRLYSHKLIPLSCLNPIKVVLLLLLRCLLFETFVLSFSLHFQQSISSSFLRSSIPLFQSFSSFFRPFSYFVIMNFPFFNRTFLLVFDLGHNFKVVDTCSVVVRVGICEKLLKRFCVIIGWGLVLFFLDSLFLFVSLSEFLSLNSLQPFELLSCLSSLLCQSFFERLFLFFFMKPFYGLWEPQTGVFVKLNFAFFFLLLLE